MICLNKLTERGRAGSEPQRRQGRSNRVDGHAVARKGPALFQGHLRRKSKGRRKSEESNDLAGREEANGSSRSSEVRARSHQRSPVRGSETGRLAHTGRVEQTKAASESVHGRTRNIELRTGISVDVLREHPRRARTPPGRERGPSLRRHQKIPGPPHRDAELGRAENALAQPIPESTKRREERLARPGPREALDVFESDPRRRATREQVEKLPKTRRAWVMQIATRATHRVGLAGRRHPPEFGPRGRKLVGRRVLEVRLPEGRSRPVEAIHRGRGSALIDGRDHLGPVGQSRGATPDPAKKLKNLHLTRSSPESSQAASRPRPAPYINGSSHFVTMSRSGFFDLRCRFACSTLRSELCSRSARNSVRTAAIKAGSSENANDSEE